MHIVPMHGQTPMQGQTDLQVDERRQHLIPLYDVGETSTGAEGSKSPIKH